MDISPESKRKSGCFISLEGCEGAGKSTCMQWIQQWFASQQVPLIATREPGGTPIAEEIRQLILAPRVEPMTAMTELLLVFAARAQHLAEVIQPALNAGKWVLSDRFTDASYAYQGAGRALDLTIIRTLQQLVHPDIMPDLTLLLDLPVETGLSRVEKRRGEKDRLEQEQLSFFHKIRESYLSLAKANPERFRIVDASVRQEEVQKQVEKILVDFYLKKING